MLNTSPISPRADQVTHGEPVAVPSSALVHGDDPVVFGGRGDDGVGVVAAQAHRLLDHDVLAGAQELECEFGVQDGRRGDDRDVDRWVGGERLGGVVGDEIGEVGAGRDEAVADRVGGGDESEAVGFGGGEAVQVAHRSERSVADDADAEVVGLRRCRRLQQAGDERCERRMPLQRVEVGDAGGHDPPGAEVAHGDRGVVDEPDAGGRGDGDAAVDGLQCAQRRGDGDLAVEPGGSPIVGEGDEPLVRAAGRHATATPASAAASESSGSIASSTEPPASATRSISAARSASSRPETIRSAFHRVCGHPGEPTHDARTVPVAVLETPVHEQFRARLYLRPGRN